jgi:hypothetical protein
VNRDRKIVSIGIHRDAEFDIHARAIAESLLSAAFHDEAGTNLAMEFP